MHDGEREKDKLQWGAEGAFHVLSSILHSLSTLLTEHAQYLYIVSATVTIHYCLGSNRFKTGVKWADYSLVGPQVDR